MAINRTVLVGRLTADPSLRYTPAGKAVCSFTLAVDRQKKDAGADFLPIIVWEKLGELCAQYLKKGRLAAIDGRIQTRNYDGNDGRKVYVTEIVADSVQFLERADAAQNGSNNQSGQSSSYGNQSGSGGGYGGNSGYGGGYGSNPFADDGKPIDISDDLPF